MMDNNGHVTNLTGGSEKPSQKLRFVQIEETSNRDSDLERLIHLQEENKKMVLEKLSTIERKLTKLDSIEQTVRELKKENEEMHAAMQSLNLDVEEMK